MGLVALHEGGSERFRGCGRVKAPLFFGVVVLEQGGAGDWVWALYLCLGVISLFCCCGGGVGVLAEQTEFFIIQLSPVTGFPRPPRLTFSISL
jgi:hypothetical protein